MEIDATPQQILEEAATRIEQDGWFHLATPTRESGTDPARKSLSDCYCILTAIDTTLRNHEGYKLMDEERNTALRKKIDEVCIHFLSYGTKLRRSTFDNPQRIVGWYNDNKIRNLQEAVTLMRKAASHGN